MGLMVGLKESCNRVCGIGFKYCLGCLKETLQMVSEYFRIYVGSECTNWKGIISDATVRC